MCLKRTLQGITKGHRFQVPKSIVDMNERVTESHRLSPWAGNRPGVWAGAGTKSDEDYGGYEGEE
jgi:hypothetical protein